jgi:hypothetical protein
MSSSPRSPLTARAAAGLAAVLALGVAGGAAAPAGARTGLAPTVSARPGTVAPGGTLTIRGAHWAVIEFCRPRVSVSVAGRVVAHPRLRPQDGSFRVRWRVPRGTPPGAQTIRAAQRCESARDGHAYLVRRGARIRVSPERRTIARARRRDLLVVLAATRTPGADAAPRATVTIAASRLRHGAWRALGRRVVGRRDGFFWFPLTGAGAVRDLHLDPRTGKIRLRLLLTPALGYSAAYRFIATGGGLRPA